jgi:hypothetical protein
VPLSVANSISGPSSNGLIRGIFASEAEGNGVPPDKGSSEGRGNHVPRSLSVCTVAIKASIFRCLVPGSVKSITAIQKPRDQ